ncbi:MULTISPECIES: hypothetical protein [unclassified Acinetobacter]|uniref:DUF4870 family protein n=1 Tax=unclassified Acinetobacter TaxID=196816 RepID=UPI002934DCF4|nr:MULTISPECIES: hypothetical protein [unclassified Acinetobacter]WOE31029.1 hypothetical protein QSG84_11850 [Acinetobacter sp. SAAs470]WOE39225.1 hypothetical protein QSG86_05515 [Acinetobacter sp. SAAs474]
MTTYTPAQDSQKTLTLILYVLYIVAIVTGGILAIIALMINYIKRSDMDGSIFASHFTWQIRTFWWYLFWNIIAFIPFGFLFWNNNNPDIFAGIALGASLFCFAVIALSWVWIVYRAIRGLIYLSDNKPMYSE